MSFDIEQFAKGLYEQHPELLEEVEATSNQIQFETDVFEKQMANDWVELAEQICKCDEQKANEDTENTVSKKQQSRDRQTRLEAMMNEGRRVYETNELYHKKMLKTEGPMRMLADAVEEKKRVEVRTRGAVRIDRIFEGIPTTFDEHFNMMLNDVTETVVRGRKDQKEVANRNFLQNCLPEFLRWKEFGNWPLPIGKNRMVEHRFHRSCLVKGDSVVLIKLNS